MERSLVDVDPRVQIGPFLHTNRSRAVFETIDVKSGGLFVDPGQSLVSSTSPRAVGAGMDAEEAYLRRANVQMCKAIANTASASCMSNGYQDRQCDVGFRAEVVGSDLGADEVCVSEEEGVRDDGGWGLGGEVLEALEFPLLAH